MRLHCLHLCCPRWQVLQQLAKPLLVPPIANQSASHSHPLSLWHDHRSGRPKSRHWQPSNNSMPTPSRRIKSVYWLRRQSPTTQWCPPTNATRAWCGHGHRHHSTMRPVKSVPSPQGLQTGRPSAHPNPDAANANAATFLQRISLSGYTTACLHSIPSICGLQAAWHH